MSQSPLHGLNLIPQPSNSSHNPNDLLAGGQYQPDLAAQLELWTNLAFNEDSPPPTHSIEKEESKKDTDDKQEPQQRGQQQAHSSPMDLNALLAGFMGQNHGNNATGFPSFPIQSSQQQPTLSQLLALGPPPQASPISNTTPSANGHSNSSSSSSEPPAKRARTSSSRKSSISTPSASSPASPISTTGFPDLQVTPAEDKRRRNTAASARFRLKKKEREAALETRAKELESRVQELERECEGLRRENGWLKGLVVGVTGAVQRGPQQEGRP